MKASTIKLNGSVRGFSLIEALVATGLIAIVGATLFSINITGMKANKSNLVRSEVLDVKNTITNLISCEQTFSDPSFASSSRPITCPSGTVVTLKGKSGQPLTASNKIGEWTITARCEQAGLPLSNGLSVYATRTLAVGGFMADPLRGIPFDESHPVSALFKPGLRPCSGFFSNNSAGSGITPGGLCQTFATPWTRGAPGTSKSGPWSYKIFECPAAFPVVMSVTSTPACASEQWAATMIKTGGSAFLNAAFCNNVFLEDSGQNIPALTNVCNAAGNSITTASCSYACCNF